MSEETKIQFIKGSGAKLKAYYQIGDAKVPASAITRIMSKIAGMEERIQSRKFASALDGAYDGFLNALDCAGISIPEAIQQITTLSVKPERQKREKKGSVLVKTIAKALAKHFVDQQPAKMVEEFATLIDSEAFKSALIAKLEGFETAFGRSGQKKIKVRKATEAMTANIEKARAERNNKK